MATTRSRARRTPAQLALEALQWIWATLLTLAFIAAGLALAGGGAIFAISGGEAMLNPEDTGHLIAGVLFAVLGLAEVVGGVLTIFWLMSHAVLKLSGRRPSSLLGGGSEGFSGGFFGGGDGGCGGDGGGGGGEGGGSC